MEGSQIFQVSDHISLTFWTLVSLSLRQGRFEWGSKTVRDCVVLDFCVMGKSDNKWRPVCSRCVLGEPQTLCTYGNFFFQLRCSRGSIKCILRRLFVLKCDGVVSVENVNTTSSAHIQHCLHVHSSQHATHDFTSWSAVNACFYSILNYLLNSRSTLSRLRLSLKTADCECEDMTVSNVSHFQTTQVCPSGGFALLLI